MPCVADCVEADAAMAPDTLPIQVDAGQLDAEEPPDSGPPDLGPPDAGWVGPDVGVARGLATCSPCGAACPGECVSAGGPNFCVDRCTDAPDSCLAGMSCVDIGAASVCVPPLPNCAEPLLFDTPCFGDVSGCHPNRDVCQGDVLGVGYCTSACPDGACPATHVCELGDDGERVCLSRLLSGAERCGREGRPDEVPCATDSSCPSGLSCMKGESWLPGICAPACSASCPGECRFDETGRSLCLPARCSCRGSGSAEGDLLAVALSELGHTRCSAVLSPWEWSSSASDLLSDPFRMSFTNGILAEPWTGPRWAASLSAQIEALDGTAVRRAERLVELLAVALDRPAERVDERPLDLSNPLAATVISFVRTAGGVPDEASILGSAATVPLEVQLAASRVIEGAERALRARQIALAFDQASLDALYDYGAAFIAPRADGFALNVGATGVADALVSGIRHARLYGGAADLLDAIEVSGIGQMMQVPTTTTATTPRMLFDVDTPVGRIGIGDAEPGLYDDRTVGARPWAILIDLGGDDEYRIGAGGNASSTNAVSLLLDLGGADFYGYAEVGPADGARLPSDQGGRRADPPMSLSETPRQGGARAGIAALVDYGGGDDVYRSLRLSQGAAAFGVGVLVDDGGDDEYETEAAGQGAATFGIGLIVDGGGADRHRAYQEAQGFGFARGVGVLLDLAGNDEYELDVGDPALGGDPLYPSDQRPEASNASLGQGFGFGRRDDQGRAFMSGGLGILEDLAGDDRYSSSVFGGGGGYWFGSGILADRGGADQYDGLWYSMGAAAHFALGFLLDESGDDTYGATIPAINVTLGAGHDFSSAFLVDGGGDDEYVGARITLGAGNASGNGLMVDRAGNDRYSTRSPYGLGAAGLLDPDLRGPGSPRRQVEFFGVFIDGGGVDEYETPNGVAGDDRVWTQSQSLEPEISVTERGVGVDAEGEVGL